MTQLPASMFSAVDSLPNTSWLFVSCFATPSGCQKVFAKSPPVWPEAWLVGVFATTPFAAVNACAVDCGCRRHKQEAKGGDDHLCVDLWLLGVVIVCHVVPV